MNKFKTFMAASTATFLLAGCSVESQIRRFHNHPPPYVLISKYVYKYDDGAYIIYRDGDGKHHKMDNAISIIIAQEHNVGDTIK